MPDGKLDPDVLKFKAAELSRAGKVCRDLGLSLASHNHLRETERNAEELIGALSQTDPKLVSLLFDVGYGYQAKLDTPAFVRKYGSRVAGFHVRDYQGAKEVQMGEGEVDLKGFARALHETRWKGWVILETNQVKGASSRDLAQGARTYMKKELGI
jgi:inosose dehydratase